MQRKQREEASSESGCVEQAGPSLRDSRSSIGYDAISIILQALIMLCPSFLR
jgi:hypothetical protein